MVQLNLLEIKLLQSQPNKTIIKYIKSAKEIEIQQEQNPYCKIYLERAFESKQQPVEPNETIRKNPTFLFNYNLVLQEKANR